MVPLRQGGKLSGHALRQSAEKRHGRRIPDRADVVIVGGGIAGCSVAYHLTKLGITDVVLCERKQLTCGTTWHAAGLVTQLRATRRMTELAKYTGELFGTLEAETGQATGFKRRGSLRVAKTPGTLRGAGARRLDGPQLRPARGAGQHRARSRSAGPRSAPRASSAVSGFRRTGRSTRPT